MALFLLVFGALGLALFAFSRQRRILNGDRDQHHLASLLIAAVSGEEGVSPQLIRHWMADKGWSMAERRKRVAHGLRLAGGAVSGDGYPPLLALARNLMEQR